MSLHSHVIHQSAALLCLHSHVIHQSEAILCLQSCYPSVCSPLMSAVMLSTSLKISRVSTQSCYPSVWSHLMSAQSCYPPGWSHLMSAQSCYPPGWSHWFQSQSYEKKSRINNHSEVTHLYHTQVIHKSEALCLCHVFVFVICHVIHQLEASGVCHSHVIYQHVIYPPVWSHLSLSQSLLSISLTLLISVTAILSILHSYIRVWI